MSTTATAATPTLAPDTDQLMLIVGAMNQKISDASAALAAEQAAHERTTAAAASLQGEYNAQTNKYDALVAQHEDLLAQIAKESPARDKLHQFVLDNKHLIAPPAAHA